jgi:transposase
MDLKQAFAHFVNSEVYKEKVKGRDSEAGKLRGYLSRHNSGKLKESAMRNLLLQYGYKATPEDWKAPKPPKKKK